MANMASSTGTSSSNYSPQKASSGLYIYSKSKKVNQVLNQMVVSDSRIVQNLGQVQGFSHQTNNSNLTSGVFSTPQTSTGASSQSQQQANGNIYQEI